jgi:hypothetical protein
MVIQLWVSSHIGLIRNSFADQLDDYHRTEISLQEEIIENHVKPFFNYHCQGDRECKKFSTKLDQIKSDSHVTCQITQR